MLFACRVCRLDSFKAARGDVRALFAPFLSHTTPSVSVEQVDRRVRQYILTQSRTLQRAGVAQQRSWVRANVSLVLREARTLQCSPVALAALRVALEESKLLATMDSVWLKDAAAACTSVNELRELQALLQQYRSRLEPGTGSSSASGSQQQQQQLLQQSSNNDLLSMLVGGSAGAGMDSALSSVAVPEGANELRAITTAAAVSEAAHALQHTSITHRSGKATTLRELQEEERRVVDALTPHRPQPVGVELVRGEQRILRGLRRLQEQREVSCALAPNQSFIRYFQKQGIVHSEAEVIALFQAMKRRRTVATFRVRRGHVYSRAVEDMLLAQREGIRRITWLPRRFAAYAMNCDAHVSYDGLLANRQLLKALSKERLVSYQNVASMLPVYFLQPVPGDRVLDLCAAPGSKTSLLLDCLHEQQHKEEEQQHEEQEGGALGAGCVVANEAHEGRSAELCTRLRGCDVRLAVTRMRGESLGGTQDTPHHTSASLTYSSSSDGEACYDKVLVDAPCSAEGRMGQDAMLWRLWHPCKGLEFFARQVSLLQRAVRLCRRGGRVLYATCTLNPIENEAVVAAVLRACRGSVELCAPPSLPTPYTCAKTANTAESSNDDEGDEEEEDCGMPPMELSRGLPTWWVPSRDGGFYRSWSEAVARGETDRLRPELFAPGCCCCYCTSASDNTPDEASEAAIAEQLRGCCRRVLPHRNPGAEGFFFALLHVKGVVPDESDARHGRLLAQQGTSLPPPSSLSSPQPHTQLSAPMLSLSRQSIFYDRGFVTLPAGHHTVQQQLGPFFLHAVSSAHTLVPQQPQARSSRRQEYRSVADFLAQQQLEVVWHGEEGLRLVARDAVRVVKRLTTCEAQSIRTSNTMKGYAGRSSARGALLELGVLTLDARGALTSDGACVLRDHATSRVLPLPLPQVQLLLAQSVLHLSRHEAEAEAKALRELYPLSATGGETREDGVNTHSAARDDGYEWLDRLQSDMARWGGSGNAIVVVAQDVQDVRSGRSRPLEPWRHALLRPWAIPVRVEMPSDAQSTARKEGVQQGTQAGVTLQLLLSPEARQRCTAMLGRIEAAWQRQAARHATTLRARLQDMAVQDASSIMSPNVLHGVPVSSSHNVLTMAAAAATDRTRDVMMAAATAAQGEAASMYERVVEL